MESSLFKEMYLKISAAHYWPFSGINVFRQKISNHNTMNYSKVRVVESLNDRDSLGHMTTLSCVTAALSRGNDICPTSLIHHDSILGLLVAANNSREMNNDARSNMTEASSSGWGLVHCGDKITAFGDNDKVNIDTIGPGMVTSCVDSYGQGWTIVDSVWVLVNIE